MLWLLFICKFFSDFLCFDTSLLFVTVTLWGVSNKHCLLSLFSLSLFSHMQNAGFLMTQLICCIIQLIRFSPVFLNGLNLVMFACEVR